MREDAPITGDFELSHWPWYGWLSCPSAALPVIPPHVQDASQISLLQGFVQSIPPHTPDADHVCPQTSCSRAGTQVRSCSSSQHLPIH